MLIDLRIHHTIREIPEASWNALDGVAEAPFLSHAFLDTLEETRCVGRGTGWIPYHMSFWSEGRLVAAAPAYLKDNSEGEFVFDHGWASAAHRIRLRYYPKLIVAVPFTPARYCEPKTTLSVVHPIPREPVRPAEWLPSPITSREPFIQSRRRRCTSTATTIRTPGSSMS